MPKNVDSQGAFDLKRFRSGRGLCAGGAIPSAAAVNVLRRSAYREAIALARQGLGLLATLPDTDERARQELSLQMTLGVPLIATEGYAPGSPERLPQGSGSSVNDSERHRRFRRSCGGCGPSIRSRPNCRPRSTYEFLRLERDLLPDALNPGVTIRCFAAWFIGHPDRALVRMQEAVALARHLSEPHSLAHALVFAAILHQLRRERELTERHADEVTALAVEHGLLFHGAMAEMPARVGR